MLHELPLGAMRIYAMLRVHQSDQALVNDGGCLSPMAAAWICVNEGVVDIFSYTGHCGLHVLELPIMQSMLELPKS